jgi:hypothetical protein
VAINQRRALQKLQGAAKLRIDFSCDHRRFLVLA